MKSNALIICNGEPPGKMLAKRMAEHADLIVAADGGANVARQCGLRPDVIIGDFDSITAATRKFFATSQLIRVSRQDNTDLEKALDYLVEKQITKATILAATGKRLDHTLGNLAVIWNYVESLDLKFVGGGWTAIPIRKKIKVRAKKGSTVSLIPSGPCTGITLQGLKYPLVNASMNIGEIGVSNVVTHPSFSIEVKRGNLLMILHAAPQLFKILQ